MSAETDQILALHAAKYPLPSTLRGERPQRRITDLWDTLANLRARYPLPSEMRARRAAEAVEEAARQAEESAPGSPAEWAFTTHRE